MMATGQSSRLIDSHVAETRVSDRHLTMNSRMHRSHQITWTAWQTRWLVAVHLHPMLGLGC